MSLKWKEMMITMTTKTWMDFKKLIKTNIIQFNKRVIQKKWSIQSQVHTSHNQSKTILWMKIKSMREAKKKRVIIKMDNKKSYMRNPRKDSQ